VLDNLVTGAAAIVATGVAIPQISLAAVVDTDTVEFQRQKDKLSYTIKIPSTCKETQKPVRTHLDEVNFVSDQVKGYQYGVTVDPVRINSLREVRTEQNTSRR
jgi:non-homologous end joining protein Ku